MGTGLGMRWGALALVVAGACGSMASALPPVPYPPENPHSEAKRILGKMLFWDEQVSSDNTMACGTCHAMARGGSDNRRDRHPGGDTLFFTSDDTFGSPGVVDTLPDQKYTPSPLFGFAFQVTGRTAPPMINAAYGVEMFLDGRAADQYVDPVTSAVVIATGGGLESQVVGPPTNSVEMAHRSRDWASISTKLVGARPMALATNLPPDVSAALTPTTTYADLFQAAFGSATITPSRIAFAIATYERTLISDDTPWDRFIAGDTGAMTATQIQGWADFQTANCTLCHPAPLFTDHTFVNIGLRPPAEDIGREAVTGLAADRGKFKSISLRNVGLRGSYMHNGMFSTLNASIQFYNHTGTPQFPENQDPRMAQVVIPPGGVARIQAFLSGGLTDARVQNKVFPFDEPTLWSLRAPDKPTGLPGGNIGTDAFLPNIIAVTPPLVGNPDFKIGISRGLGGATARLGISSSPPVSGVITPSNFVATITLDGVGGGAGYGTALLPIPPNPLLNGQTVYYQWFVDDAGASGGEARSVPVSVKYFCAGMGCPPTCFADLDNGSGNGTPDGAVDISDLLYYLNLFDVGDIAADVDDGSGTGTQDGGVDISDLLYYLDRFGAGC